MTPHNDDAVARREEMDQRNARRRCEYAKRIRLWTDAPQTVALPDPDFDEFLSEKGW